MRRYSLLLLGGTLAATLSLGAAARGPGPGGGFTHGTPGGPPPNSAALENSNGRFSSDRDKGLDRAQERMSEQGRKHQKATDAQNTQGNPVPNVRPAEPAK